MPGVDTGGSLIDGADTFVFDKNAIHSYNDAVSVSVPFKTEEPLHGSVQVKEFFRLVSKIPQEEIEITPDENVWKIKAGGLDAEIILKETKIGNYVADLSIEDLEWKPLPAEFMGAVKLCKIGCNKSTNRGIFVNKNQIVSTDIMRINLYNLSEEMDLFFLDDPAVTELIKGNWVEYCISAAWAHFRGKDGSVIFSCKRKDESTYQIQKILQVCENHEVGEGDVKNKLPKNVKDVVDRVSTLAADIEGAQSVLMILGKDKLTIKSEKSVGNIKEAIKWDDPFEDDPEIQFWVDADFLMEAVTKVPNFYVKTVDGRAGKMKTLVFRSEKYMQIVSTYTKS